MAKKQAKEKIQQDTLEEKAVTADSPRPKLKKLEVSNFRSIGDQPVSIDLDDIVVLVGPNNAGKSSILKAYQIAMSHGSKEGELTIEDFPKEEINKNKLPTIILTTAVVDSNSPGQKWIIEDLVTKEKLVKERWFWNEPGKATRQGFDGEKKDWVDEVPWGAPGIANARRPKPYRVDSFDSPEKQANEIIKIITDSLEEKISGLRTSGNSQGSDGEFQNLLKKISELQQKVIKDSQDQIKDIEDGISNVLQAIFPNYVVKFDGKPEAVDEQAVSFFKAGGRLTMGPQNGFLGGVNQHGSGARRTLLWAALKYINEAGLKKSKKTDASDRPHILLIDEPELCLHPSAVRQACNVLYDLPKNKNWQVMVTTHSPIFIDLSRDNTTVIRVDRLENGQVSSCTLHRPEKAKLSEEDKKELKLLNLFDPYVAEFFFGGSIVLVEGDTEYSTLKFVAEEEGFGKNLHIIRARGKSTIASLAKILNQFSAKYAVLHDSDRPHLQGSEKKNSAWSVNETIQIVISEHQNRENVRLVASIPNFEEAYLGGPSKKGDKPYNALLKIKDDNSAYLKVKNLLIGLTNFEATLPNGCLQWTALEDLEKAIDEKTGS